MPTKLSDRPEELARQFVVGAIRPSEMQGYDPTQTDSQATDFLPVTTDWSNYGEYYPMIYIGENDGPQIPNSGTTNANGIQGDGSGVNQYAIHNITISVQVVEEGSYLNGTDYDDLAHDIYQEVKHQFQNSITTAIPEAEWSGIPTPPTPTRNQEETDSSTLTWYQLQGTVPVGFQDEP